MNFDNNEPILLDKRNERLSEVSTLDEFSLIENVDWQIDFKLNDVEMVNNANAVEDIQRDILNFLDILNQEAKLCNRYLKNRSLHLQKNQKLKVLPRKHVSLIEKKINRIKNSKIAYAYI